MGAHHCSHTPDGSYSYTGKQLCDLKHRIKRKERLQGSEAARTCMPTCIAARPQPSLKKNHVQRHQPRIQAGADALYTQAGVRGPLKEGFLPQCVVLECFALVPGRLAHSDCEVLSARPAGDVYHRQKRNGRLSNCLSNCSDTFGQGRSGPGRSTWPNSESLMVGTHSMVKPAVLVVQPSTPTVLCIAAAFTALQACSKHAS